MTAVEFLEDADWTARARQGAPALDVRAAVEFSQGAIPGATNLPILNDDERQLVGTCYKEQGPEAALALGHELVSGAKKAERVASWVDYFGRQPGAYLYCFRGGQRSAIAQAWLREAGVSVPRLAGGYKRARQFYLEALEREPARHRLAILSGYTGSGKTRLLREIQRESPHVGLVDLELLARHRGSAFGRELTPQPEQAAFENALAARLLGLSQTLLWFEDESRMIGRLVVPEPLYRAMCVAPLYFIREPLESRARLILEEYVIEAYEQRRAKDPETALDSLAGSLCASVRAISKKLGGARTDEALRLIDAGMAQARSGDGWEGHLPWIELLLKSYYDPFYEKHRARASSRMVLEAEREEMKELIARKV
ncbi:MAG: tRNA 2-selenouridine(34) synthase MnmH [Oligoflexia bacterium]|nr:tRNA 2-selenouridine(34) synthase MnmH [Oligoflexia bacterium]